MAAVLPLTMNRSRLTCLIVSFVFCTHLVKSTMSLDIVNIFQTRHDFGKRQSRKRRQDSCFESQTFTVFQDKYDRNAEYELVGETVKSAPRWCMRNKQCTAYVVKGDKVFYSTNIKLWLVHDSDAFTCSIFRCPKRFVCNDLPCNNGGTCVPPFESGLDSLRCRCYPEWTGWYCEHLKNKTCADKPCKLGETCRNSAITGFICRPNVASTTRIVTSRNTIVTSTTAPNKTMNGSVLSRDAKVVIGAAAVGGVVITGVAAVVVISATSSSAATTAAGAAGGQ